MDKLDRGRVTTAEVPLSKAFNPPWRPVGGLDSSCTGCLAGQQAACGPVQHLNSPATLGHKPNKHTNKGENVSSLYDLCLLHSVVQARLSLARSCPLCRCSLPLTNLKSSFTIVTPLLVKFPSQPEQLQCFRLVQFCPRTPGQPPWQR